MTSITVLSAPSQESLATPRTRICAATESSTPSGVRLVRSSADDIVITECTVTALLPAGTPRSTLIGTQGLEPSSSSPKQNE